MSDTDNRTKRLQYAAALKYKPGENDAPQVVALGKGTVAQQIITVAREAGIPIHEDPELAYTLSSLEVGQEIPVELYRAVAEVLAFIMSVDSHKASSPR